MYQLQLCAAWYAIFSYCTAKTPYNGSVFFDAGFFVWSALPAFLFLASRYLILYNDIVWFWLETAQDPSGCVCYHMPFHIFVVVCIPKEFLESGQGRVGCAILRDIQHYWNFVMISSIRFLLVISR